MQIAFEVLQLLSEGKFISGTEIANTLKISRSSVWKAIRFLKQLNLCLHAVPGRGYRWSPRLELLDKTQILQELSEKSKQRLARIDVTKLIASTNEYLLSRLSNGLPNGTVCVAEGQSQGRGRQGKVWISPFGRNIYLSLLWRFEQKLHDLSSLSLVIGLAVLKTLQTFGPLPPTLGLKWPNDIWFDGRKIAGILLESVFSKERDSSLTHVVIGIGINVQMHLESNDDWSDLSHVFGFIPSRNLLISRLLNQLVVDIELFCAKGFSEFLVQWENHNLLRGKHVQLSTHQGTKHGIARGINERGELCVTVDENLIAVRYGEVSVRPQEI